MAFYYYYYLPYYYCVTLYTVLLLCYPVYYLAYYSYSYFYIFYYQNIIRIKQQFMFSCLISLNFYLKFELDIYVFVVFPLTLTVTL